MLWGNCYKGNLLYTEQIIIKDISFMRHLLQGVSRNGALILKIN